MGWMGGETYLTEVHLMVLESLSVHLVSLEGWVTMTATRWISSRFEASEGDKIKSRPVDVAYPLQR